MPTVVTTSTAIAAALANRPAFKIHSAGVSVGARDDAASRRPALVSLHPARPSHAATSRFTIHGSGIVAVRLVNRSTYAPPGGRGGTHRIGSRGNRKSKKGHRSRRISASGLK